MISMRAEPDGFATVNTITNHYRPPREPLSIIDANHLNTVA